MSTNNAKHNAAAEALKLVKPGMTLGLGTGSTATCFIEMLQDLIKEGYDLKGVPTSEATRALAENVGIDIIEPSETTVIDLAVDGADEADEHLNLIKGGGGALFREKIVAYSAKHFVVIADKTKRVPTLGSFALPIEIEPFGWALTIAKIRETLAEQGFGEPMIKVRPGGDNVFKSDGGNLIVDCALGRIEHPARLDELLTDIPGVVVTGLFYGLVDMIIYGDDDGVSIVKP